MTEHSDKDLVPHLQTALVLIPEDEFLSEIHATNNSSRIPRIGEIMLGVMDVMIETLVPRDGVILIKTYQLCKMRVGHKLVLVHTEEGV